MMIFQFVMWLFTRGYIKVPELCLGLLSREIRRLLAPLCGKIAPSDQCGLCHESPTEEGSNGCMVRKPIGVGIKSH